MLYDENNKSVLPLPIIKVGEGSTSKVYRLSLDKCVKIYNEACNEKFSKEIKMIRDLNLMNFYKIYSLLYNKNGDIAGYIMKYYHKEGINLLIMPTDYLLDNLNILLKSFAILSDNNIRCCDLHRNNVILNTSGIYVIDADDYLFEEETSKSTLLSENTEEVVKLFEDLMALSISRYFGKPCISKGKFIRENYNLFSLNDSTRTDGIFKKLVKYKYPIDYFKSKVR